MGPTISPRAVLIGMLGIGIVAVLVVLPIHFRGTYWQTLGFLTFLFGGLGVAWNILGGYGGQISFGHSAFLGLGGFTTAVITLRSGVPAPFTIPIAGLIAMLYGLAWGYPTLRLRGPYFSIATIGIGEATRLLMINLDDLLRHLPVVNTLVRDKALTGGASGLTLSTPANIQSYALGYYFSALLFLLLALAVSWWIRRSRFGLALLAINMDPDAAETLGVSTTRYKVLALMTSAFLVGVGGSVYAQFFLFIDPRDMFSFQNSITMVLMPIIGGLGTLWGPLIGAVVFKVVDSLVSTSRVALGGLTIDFVQFSLLLYGLLLVLIILYEPGGVLGVLGRARRLWSSRRLGGSVEHRA